MRAKLHRTGQELLRGKEAKELGAIRKIVDVPEEREAANGGWMEVSG